MKSISYKKNLKTKIRENPDESWDFFMRKFWRNSVKILIQNFKRIFIFGVLRKAVMK